MEQEWRCTRCDKLLAVVRGEDLSITRDVPEALDDLHDLFGDGEWEL